MNIIEEIDQTLTNQLAQLKDEVRKMNFKEEFIFQLSDQFDSSIISQLNYSGIYLFEIKIENQSIPIQNWIKEFIEKWEIAEYKAEFVPNSRKGRIMQHTINKEWLPLYLGKSKNISSRIYEHIHKKMFVRSGGLKLIERRNIHGITFRVSTIPIKVKNYDLILPYIETYFRELLQPILGRQ